MADEESNLLTNLKSIVKTYLVHDALGRIIASYEAKSAAVSGEPCVKTVYDYRGPASTQIQFRQEFNSTWDPDDQGWDRAIVLPDPLVDPAP